MEKKSLHSLKQMKVEKTYAEEFYKDKLVATVYLLNDLKKTKYTKHILRHLAKRNIDKGFKWIRFANQ